MVVFLLLRTMYKIYQCINIELVDEIDDIWLPVKYLSLTPLIQFQNTNTLFVCRYSM